MIDPEILDIIRQMADVLREAGERFRELEGLHDNPMTRLLNGRLALKCENAATMAKEFRDKP